MSGVRVPPPLPNLVDIVLRYQLAPGGVCGLRPILWQRRCAKPAPGLSWLNQKFKPWQAVRSILHWSVPSSGRVNDASALRRRNPVADQRLEHQMLQIGQGLLAIARRHDHRHHRLAKPFVHMAAQRDDFGQHFGIERSRRRLPHRRRTCCISHRSSAHRAWRRVADRCTILGVLTRCARSGSVALERNAPIRIRPICRYCSIQPDRGDGMVSHRTVGLTSRTRPPCHIS